MKSFIAALQHTRPGVETIAKSAAVWKANSRLLTSKARLVQPIRGVGRLQREERTCNETQTLPGS